MRVKNVFKNKNRLSHKKTICLFIGILLTFLNTSFVFAQNGIPLDVLRKNPYFRKDDTEEETEEQTSAQSETVDANTQSDSIEQEEKEKQEEEKTSVEETKNTEKQTAETEDSTTNIPISEETKKLLNNENNSEKKEVTIPKAVTETEEIIDAKIDLALGYMCFYTFELQPGGLAYYFDMNKSANINPYGTAVRIEFMTLPYFLGVNGFGINATWSPLKRVAEHYTLKTNLVTANIFYAHKVRFPKTRLLLEFHVGGGGMMILLPSYTYETGYKPESYNWIYPEAVAGVAFQFYFTRHWGLDLSVDAVYPFLIEVPFPVVQATLSSGWHF